MYYNPGNVLRLNGSMPDLWTGDGDIYIYFFFKGILKDQE